MLIQSVHRFSSASSLVYSACVTVARVYHTLVLFLLFRRDKYTFHQTNIIPAEDLSGKSALERWYEDVMTTLSLLITFPVKVMFQASLTVKMKLRRNTRGVAELIQTCTGILLLVDNSERAMIEKGIGNCELTSGYCLQPSQRLRNPFASGYLAYSGRSLPARSLWVNAFPCVSLFWLML